MFSLTSCFRHFNFINPSSGVTTNISVFLFRKIMSNINIRNNNSDHQQHNNSYNNINNTYQYKDYNKLNQQRYQKSRSFYQQGRGAHSNWNNNNYQNYNYHRRYNGPFFQNYGRSFRNFRGNLDDIAISKTLAYILRHGAYNMNIYMDRSGYVYVIDILALPQFRGVREDDIVRIVQDNNKQRFHLTHDRDNYLMIGATQGHTLKKIDQLELFPITDAKTHSCVVHGTTYRAWNNIKDSGLKTMGRTHIHFAGSEPGDGRRVISGMRNSSQVLIYIDLEKALESGIKFFLSKNEVILSGGNEEGVISPAFFKDVLDRKTRKWPDETEQPTPLREMSTNIQRRQNFRQQGHGVRSRWNNDNYHPYNYHNYNQQERYGGPFIQDYGTSFRKFRKEERRPFDDVDISKKLAYILRHGAYNMNIYMDRSGYVYVIDILALPQFRGVREDDIVRIVQDNNKQRFHLTHDRDNYLMIGATQGHTLKKIDQLELFPITYAKTHPCVVHGTTYRAWNNIKDSGLKTMGRTHIHFAGSEPGDGRRVISGMRNSSQVLIYIDLEKALESGIKFFLSKNGVILSGGNEEGVISPAFFKYVIDRKTRKWPVEKKKKVHKDENTLTNPE